jgi:hypothetical protein
MPITTPQSKIENALAMFTLSVRFAEGCESGIIPLSFGWRTVHIDTGGPGLTIAPERYSKQKLVDQSYNLMLEALGHIAIIVDEALDQKYGSKDSSDTSELGSVRAIIYQIRNAFAHEPLSPTWRVKDRYRRVYAIHVGPACISFDGAALDGRNLRPVDFGGLEGYIQMLKYCHKQVSK